MATNARSGLPRPSEELLARLRHVYEDVHSHPELSMQEHRTAGIAASWLRQQGYDVTEGVGGTGVVGLLHNGDGPTVLLRADMDALPMEEATGLPYESHAEGVDRFGQPVAVAHACGHDMHVAWLMGTSRILAENRHAWRGTAMVVFQPGEETSQGASSMVADGMVDRFPKPDVALAQHVMPLPAGRIGHRSGTILSSDDSWEVTLYGRGAHGSMPQMSIDPVVMAAATVMRLQTIVSREVAMTDGAVVTVGALQAGTTENVIPDKAVLRLNIRTFDPAVRERVLGSIRRIIEAEATASGSPRPPKFDVISEYPLTKNDDEATHKVVKAFERRFGSASLQEIPPGSASEDFSRFGRAWKVPSVFWFVGGTDPKAYQAAQASGSVASLPVNHSPKFAPVEDPTLQVGIEAMVAAAGAWLEVAH